MNLSMKKIWLFLGGLITVYLLLPGPVLPPPALEDSLKSEEPGDTVQLINVSAYFTDKERDEVINFYTDYFSRSKFLNIPLLSYRLNHPPEYARDVWVETKRSYYLEEIVHPLRESLFVNGFEWEKDVFTPPQKREKNKILVSGRVWRAKVSLRWFPSFWAKRLIVFWLGWGLFYLVFSFWGKEGKEALKWLKRK